MDPSHTPAPQPPSSGPLPPAPLLPVDRPPGYVSRESKKLLITAACVLASVCLVLAFALPHLFSMMVMPFSPFGGISGSALPRIGGAAVWEGQVWHCETIVAFTKKPETKLARVTPGGDGQPQPVATLPGRDPWLLAGEDRLWIISRDSAGWYKDGALKIKKAARVPWAVSRPFLYQGQPAVLCDGPSGLSLAVLEDGQWKEVASLDITDPDGWPAHADNLQVVPVGNVLHLFHHRGTRGPLHYLRRVEEGQEPAEPQWEMVSPAAKASSAVELGGQPAVFVLDTSRPKATITGLKRGQEDWEEFFTHRTGLVVDAGVCPTGQGDDFILLLRSLPSNLRLVEVKAGQIAWQSRQAGGFPFAQKIILVSVLANAVGLVPPLTMMVVLSYLMRRHRLAGYVRGPAAARLASIQRRGLAKIVDTVLDWAPIAIAAWLLGPDLDFFADPLRFMLVAACLGCGALLWFVLTFFVFSILEGTWGRTPGKWLAGIRVVNEDLRPCGVAWALARNLLRIADAFGNYAVGMLVASLTRKWQRVGDLVAGTIVIEAPRRAQKPAA